MFEIVYETAYRIAACKNPHVFFGAGDVPEVERLAEVKRLEDLFEELMH
jgi:hypothetical protein